MEGRAEEDSVIMIHFHDLKKVKARVDRIDAGWFSAIEIEGDNYSTITLFTGGYHKHKVEAIMAAFELVDTLKAACQKLADDEGMRDLEDSVEEKRLIDGGTEALPEPQYTSKPLTGEAKVRAS
jgi:hypothetical protein